MNRILLILLVLVVYSCKENAVKFQKNAEKLEEVAKEKEVSPFENTIAKVFKAHDANGKWKKQRTLQFTIPKPNAAETHTVDLYTRKEKIETSDWVTGSNGHDIWLLDKKKSYKGDPVFYHNLMFYFYTMPFVFSDNGIIYSETGSLNFEGINYPGVAVSYEAGVGMSSKDQYYLHYDPETYQMTWLGYTVTFKSGEKSNDVRWIRYNDWQEINGLKLPKSITWYAYEGRTIKEPKRKVIFENVEINETAKPIKFYEIPENAKVVSKTK